MENKINLEGFEEIHSDEYNKLALIDTAYFAVGGHIEKYYKKKQQFPIEFKLDDNFKAILYENLNILIKNDADELWLGKYNSGRAEQILKAIEKAKELDHGK